MGCLPGKKNPMKPEPGTLADWSDQAAPCTIRSRQMTVRDFLPEGLLLAVMLLAVIPGRQYKRQFGSVVRRGKAMRRANRAAAMVRFLIVCLFISALGFAGGYRTPSPAGAQQTASVDFVRDIQPIFQASCFNCHGPKKAMGRLRLDDKRLAMKGGISGAVILPGQSGQSRLVARILGAGGEPRMPMGGDPLKPEQIELIRRWIDQGAVWPGEGEGEKGRGGEGANADLPKHWAYVRPVQPSLPAVRNTAWVRNPIDHFILARLEKEGLTPSPEASKETLLRRVYLDLTGLPPGVKEVDEFLADKSPDAYEKVVDRLLASPHYGERWARPWLDLARYADSNGYEKDGLRVMWKYRDWVI